MSAQSPTNQIANHREFVELHDIEARRAKAQETAQRIIEDFSRALSESSHAPVHERAVQEHSPAASNQASTKDGATRDAHEYFIVHAKTSMRTNEAIAQDDSSEKTTYALRDFPKFFFINAPRVHNNEIMMEKKKW